MDAAEIIFRMKRAKAAAKTQERSDRRGMFDKAMSAFQGLAKRKLALEEQKRREGVAIAEQKRQEEIAQKREQSKRMFKWGMELLNKPKPKQQSPLDTLKTRLAEKYMTDPESLKPGELRFIGMQANQKKPDVEERVREMFLRRSTAQRAPGATQERLEGMGFSSTNKPRAFSPDEERLFRGFGLIKDKGSEGVSPTAQFTQAQINERQKKRLAARKSFEKDKITRLESMRAEREKWENAKDDRVRQEKRRAFVEKTFGEWRKIGFSLEDNKWISSEELELVSAAADEAGLDKISAEIDAILRKRNY